MQVVVQAGDDTDAPSVVREVLSLDREALAPDTLGLQRGEAMDLLSAVQGALVDEQAKAALATRMACPECGRPRRHKDSRAIVVRSLFGTLRLASPRWWHCDCRPQASRTFSPLAAVLPTRVTPELQYLEAKFAGLVSYGLAAQLLGEVLPLGRVLHATAVRHHVQAVAQRLEDELGPERFSFVEGCPRDWAELPRPDLPLVVGLDGGYVHSSAQRSRRDGWFEVIAGKTMPANGPAKCFGYVQTYDKKPKRRLFEVLTSQGMAANQQVTFLTDGGEDIRDLPLYLNPRAEHLLDWFHITMRITIMTTMAKSLRSPPPDPDLPSSPPVDLAADLAKQLKRLKWFLWHGNTFRALQIIEDLVVDLDVEEPSVSQAKLLKAVGEFDSYSTCARTPPASPTTVNAAAPVRPSPPRSSNPPSTRWCPSAWSKSSRCGGHPAAPTCCSRSAPGSSTTTWPPTSTAGTPGFTHTPPDREEPVKSA